MDAQAARHVAGFPQPCRLTEALPAARSTALLVPWHGLVMWAWCVHLGISACWAPCRSWFIGTKRTLKQGVLNPKHTLENRILMRWRLCGVQVVLYWHGRVCSALDGRHRLHLVGPALAGHRRHCAGAGWHLLHGR